MILNDTIVDKLNNEKFNSVVTELFIRCLKRNSSLIFITQSYFPVQKNIKLNSRHYFIIKIPNKQVLKQIAFNHSLHIDLQDFMNLYEKVTGKTFISLLLILVSHQIILYVSGTIF